MSKAKNRAALAGSYLFVGIMAIFTVYPILYTIVGSFKTNGELTRGEHLDRKSVV